MAEPWVAQPTTTRAEALPSATTSAREMARQNKLDRNTRVDSWRNIVAASATECTCALSPASSTVVDSAASSSRTTSTTTNPEADASRSRALTPATTTTSSHEHRQHQMQYDGAHDVPAFCSVCVRLGAPMFMGQCEFEEDVETPQPKRAMSITKTLKNLTRRLTLNPNRVIRDIRKSSNEPVAPAVARDPPAKQPDAPSRDSFVESRRNKILKMHRERRQQQQAQPDVHQDDSTAGVKNRTSIDLNRVNEALMMPSPLISRPNTHRDRAPAPTDPASPPRSPDTATKPQKPRAAGQAAPCKTSYSYSSASSASLAGVANILKSQRRRTTAQGMERLERAQRLLNRDNTDGLPAQNAPLVPA